ncbi:MAG TPA: helix-turn-helix domain-containing protein [Pyrinomonadaceae bacterium]|jgi:DNA-binding NtrC family response regulator
MESVNPMEREKLRLLKRSETRGPQLLAASTTRLEALKVLALALLNEIEALGQSQGHSAVRAINLADEVRRFETDLIRGALMQTGGRQRPAARLLGMKVPTLHAKMKRYQINADDFLATYSDLLAKAR